MTLYLGIVVLAATALLGAGTWLGYRSAIHARQAVISTRLKGLVGDGGVTTKAEGGPRHQRTLWLPRRLRVAMARADLDLSRRRIALSAAGVAMLMLAMVAVYGPLAAVASLFAVAAAALWTVVKVGERRRRQCQEALPAFLDGIRQLVKVGNSLMQAVQKATATAPPAIARYFQPVAVQIQHGASLGDSIAVLAERLDIAELQMLAAAIQSNLRFGGRIGNILANLIRILRDRRQVEHEIAASTAETRATALVLGALPFLVAGWIAFNNPGYAAFFIDDPSGHAILWFALPMQVIGLLAMRRIVGVTY